MLTDGKLFGFSPYMIFVLAYTGNVGRGIIRQYGADCEFDPDRTSWEFDRLEVRKKAYLERQYPRRNISQTKIDNLFGIIDKNPIEGPPKSDNGEPHWIIKPPDNN